MLSNSTVIMSFTKFETGVLYLKNPIHSVDNVSPPDTKYMHYSLHTEGVTLQGSFLPASIDQNE